MSIKSKTPSPEFLAHYDKIDWSKGTPAPTDGRYERLEDITPVKTISTIRSDRPHVSESAAIHALQVADFNRAAARGTHYDPQGRLVSESWAARTRELRRRGLTDGWT